MGLLVGGLFVAGLITLLVGSTLDRSGGIRNMGLGMRLSDKGAVCSVEAINSSPDRFVNFSISDIA